MSTATFKEEPYFTEELYLAAAIKTDKTELEGISKHRGRGVFKFKNSDRVQKVVKDYYEGTLVQNVRDYVNNWLHLKRLVSQGNGE